ncbi:hypothetical protein G3I60_36940 [Streptomyces sp. SID13666]|uniref:hypothetical protein n=1 Tax=unclassified Streptomyces TaxID=2593676 RepID=UPI0013BF4432|nr:MULTISPECIES: hypothetical protein [unclassified Streptomyces]NEA59599.1 hypothetical protein [Streptomyces sp. SID13666]NEA75783.1 hypothetical protein [Streptomyces sp. SID13588]
MSYDLAVWQGDVPSNAREAARAHDLLFDRYLEGDELLPVTTAVAEFLAVLTDRWPDRDTGDDTPWASTPLSEGASGPYVYLTLAWSSAEVVSAYVANVAKNLGLNCFDPQMRALRSG